MKLRFEPVHKLCTAATEDGTVPGSVLLVVAGGTVVFHDAFGARQLVPRKLPVFRDTLFDVASLTKAVVTSVLAMREVGAGRLRLDRRVAELLPEFEGEERAQVTVRELLSHSSGLPAHRPFWRQAAEAPSGRRAISLLAAREPLEYVPGTRAVYSDLGFILLGWLLERRTGERLDALARRQIIAPLGLTATTFMSLSDPDDRMRVLVDRDVVRMFWTPSGVEGSTWRLGWDGPAAASSQAGTKFSRAGVGHLGLRGCSLWIEPAREM